MNFVFAEPIAKIIESVGLLMTLSLVICFIIVVVCLCLKMCERMLPKQNSQREEMGNPSLKMLGNALKSSPKKF